MKNEKRPTESPKDPSADAPTEPAADSPGGATQSPGDNAKENGLKRVSRDDQEKGRPKNTGRMGA